MRLPARRRPRRGDRRPRPARGRGEGVHALHPPDAPLPRAVRLPRGPVPGRRGRLAAPAGAAVLPGDQRGRRSTGSARRSPRRCGQRVDARRPRESACHGPVRRATGPAVRAAQHLARLRPAPVAAGRSRVAGARRGRCAAPGVLDDDELELLDAGLDRGRRRARGGRVRVRRRRRGHPHGDRAAADRAGRAGRRQAAHRALAQRPGRDRPRAVRARARRAGAGADRGADGAAGRRSPSARRLADARLHPPAAGAAGLSRRITCSPTSGCCARDAARFAPPRAAPAEMPLGRARSPASTGSSTARRPRPSSASRAPRRTRSTPSPTATSSLDYLAAAAICATHLSRLGAEMVLWSSEEFGFCEPADDFSSGSSLMPQKKNPDAAELLRAKAPRVVAGFTTPAGVLHALPLAYSKDLQEDKEALFDAVDTLELCLEAAERMLAGLRVRPRAAGRGGRATRCSPRPTSPTCSCARGCRSARPTASSAAWCATALERGVALSEMSRGRARRALASCSTRSTTRCSRGQLDGVEGLAPAGPRSARARASSSTPPARGARRARARGRPA